ncbi:MAG: DUF1311 domain-containing protein [Burkholderiaceae bacterium]|jgi:uncharacterized protein YecT (DUF1311 family)|nr:DUF1311 domain-containing protein [Burkholderiaceae bacterium]
MCKIRLICLSFALGLPIETFSAPAVSTPGERALRLECDIASISQRDMHDCLEREVRKSFEALKKYENEAIDRISKWDEDERYINQTKAMLATSTKEFIRYRNAHCKFMTSLGGGAIGSALELGRLACVAELNYRRAEQLHDAVSDIPKK